MTEKIIEIDDMTFRDLDHDGVLAPFEDHRNSIALRVSDLKQRMSLAEKIGLMMHGTAQSQGPLGSLGIGNSYDDESIRNQLLVKSINHLITRLNVAPGDFAIQNNRIQAIAAQARLGIPVTISTDPRHHFQHVTGASSRALGFSQWPETTGLAATRDASITREFAGIARIEYRAIGIHMALSPQADIATEPRWSRISGTFGEYPQLARTMTEAYVEGMQNSTTGLNTESVAAVVKHWVGYGAAPDGFDGHNDYGQFSAVTDESLDYHIEPFLGAFRAHVAGVMPSYTITHRLTTNGAPVEAVAAGFSHYLLENLLRDQMDFNGFILSDWAIYRDATPGTRNPKKMQTPDDIAMPWGVTALTRIERIAKSINAGVDQLGGEEDVDALTSAVASGLVSIERIDKAVERLLRIKFELGLFDAPFVDAAQATAIVNCSEHQQLALNAQRKALVCLKKHAAVDPSALAFCNLNSSESFSEETTLIIRITSPHELLHPNHFFGSMQHEGSLEYNNQSTELEKICYLARSNPVILVIQMVRPCVINNLLPLAAGIYVDLGISDEVILEAITGQFQAQGALPFRLPESMQAVVAARSDIPGLPLQE